MDILSLVTNLEYIGQMSLIDIANHTKILLHFSTGLS